MSRAKGTKNKVQSAPVETFSFTTEQRLQLIANLLVEKIIEDQRNGKNLLSLLGEKSGAR